MESEILNTCTFEVLIGTYEEFVVGYIFKEESKELVESFATHSHQGSVRCITCSGNLVASGGSDEIIQLYNMVTRKEAGTVMQHTGTVTSLQFTPEQSHLISCSQDGSIAIHRVGNWQLEKVWATAHKGSGVSCVAIHPSGKMALSLAQNKTLRTWNLVKGRPAYTTNLASLGKFMDLVVWSTEGSYFALSADNKVFIFDASIAGIISTIECSSRITTMSFFDNTTICFGEENGWIVCHCIKTTSELWRVKASEVRVKCISFVSNKWLVTCSSDGNIIIWKVDEIQRQPVQLTSANIGCRIICMSVRTPVKIESD